MVICAERLTDEGNEVVAGGLDTVEELETLKAPAVAKDSDVDRRVDVVEYPEVVGNAGHTVVYAGTMDVTTIVV